MYWIAGGLLLIGLVVVYQLARVIAYLDEIDRRIAVVEINTRK